MPNFFNVGEATPGRLAAALSLILEGRSVGFGRFSLAVYNHELNVDVEYTHDSRDDQLARELVGKAMLDLESLLEHVDSFSESLRGLQRRYFLLVSLGKGEVRVAEFKDDQPIWYV